MCQAHDVIGAGQNIAAC